MNTPRRRLFSKVKSPTTNPSRTTQNSTIEIQRVKSSGNIQQSAIEKQERSQHNLLKSINEALNAIQSYKHEVMNINPKKTIEEELIQLEQKIIKQESQINCLHQEILILKHHPIKTNQRNTIADSYVQANIKASKYDLSQEIYTQKQHLELHIHQHSQLKASFLSVKAKVNSIIPSYLQKCKESNQKVYCLNHFKLKAQSRRKQDIKDHEERLEEIQKKRSLSSKLNQSISHRKYRVQSVKQIFIPNSSVNQLPRKKSMEEFQDKKLLLKKAAKTKEKKHEDIMNELVQQLLFLEGQDQALSVQMEALYQQSYSIDSQISSITFSNAKIGKFSKMYSAEHLLEISSKS